ncbi:rnapii degradation factor def1 [Coleophoma crateriformis]|uniref:RNA polymerase II degradation factor 1 n=1 Tax=Coleophoma crateriformis TaxID=565419 RepID=A0A3D8T7G7_9HELO|nr:rnapii degradation factor def1 [Coleophoma crateriformis]
MSEVQSRPSAPRGRGSSRGGRGGFSSRGSRGGRGHTTNGDKIESTNAASIADDSEVGQLKKKYGDKVATIQEFFPNWTDEDVVFALQETDGDLETTVERITEGSISQWGEVSKTKKDRSRSKATKDTTTTVAETSNGARPSRGGRVFDGARGGRGRGTDRGRGGRGRGASTAQTNGSRKENTEISVPTEEAWDTVKEEAPQEAPAWDTAAAETSGGDGWAATATATAAKATSSIIPDGVKKSWASMFAPVPTPKKAPAPVEKPAEAPKPEEPVEVPAAEPEVEAPEPVAEKPAEPAETPLESVVIEPEAAVTPSKDELTETNLEQVPDESAPAPTATAASTAASSWDPRSGAGSATPYSALQQGQSQAIRPPTSGFVASALKATNAGGRTPSYQRRVLDQEEAVRMPGNREVDRAAVQFGAFNLNGTGEEDVDGDREEAETRAQPPQHSPVAHPRASLPPAPQQQQPAATPESFPTPKQPAGLPATGHPTAAPGLPSPQTLPGAQSAQPGPQGNGQYGQYGRYGQAGAQEPSLPQKPYDAFSQQAPSTQSPFEGYPGQTPAQQQSGAFSSAPSEFSSYYTADPQQRNAYNSYYQQQYAQQGGQGQQDGSAPQQQRSYSGYNGDQAAASQFPQNTTQQSQSRYGAGEGQNSGHTTPNPANQSQQQAAQAAQPQPGHPQQPQAGSYPYGHPYYTSPYYAAYVNQYNQYGAGNYGAGPYGAKAGLHGQPYQGYGMSPGAPYEHASSPAGAGFGASSLHGRDSALGGSLGDYGRAGSAQSSQTPQSIGGGAFGGVHDAFGRGSSYQGQSQQHYNAQQGSQAGAGDDLKPFGESKTANGPSPSLSQAGRPGSATNTTPGSALPPPQSAQQGGYGGYPSHLQQGHGLHGQAGSQYAGLGGAGSHQAAGQGHQSSQYGGYQGFGGNYYGNSRGGWGGNYGH